MSDSIDSKIPLPPSTRLYLIHIHDSSGSGLYHVSPSLSHLAHALGCCSVSNADDAFLTSIAIIEGSFVCPIDVHEPIKLTSHPAFVEAQRVLSQAKAEGANVSEVPDGSI